MKRRNIPAMLIALLLLAGAHPSFAQSPAELAIRAALAQWTADFNARNAGTVCDLFAPDLR